MGVCGWNNRSKFNLRAMLGLVLIEIMVIIAAPNLFKTRSSVESTDSSSSSAGPTPVRTPSPLQRDAFSDTTANDFICSHRQTDVVSPTSSGSTYTKELSAGVQRPVCLLLQCKSEEMLTVNVELALQNRAGFGNNNTMYFIDPATNQTKFQETYDRWGEGVRKFVFAPSSYSMRDDAVVIKWVPDALPGIYATPHRGVYDYFTIEWSCDDPTPIPTSFRFPIPGYYDTTPAPLAKNFSEVYYTNMFPFGLGVYKTTDGEDVQEKIFKFLDEWSPPTAYLSRRPTPSESTPCQDSAVSSVYTALQHIVLAIRILAALNFLILLFYCRDVLIDPKLPQTMMSWIRFFLFMCIIAVDALILVIYFKSTCAPGGWLQGDNEDLGYPEYTFKDSFGMKWGSYVFFAMIAAYMLSMYDGMSWMTPSQVARDQRPHSGHQPLIGRDEVILALLLQAMQEGSPRMRYNNNKVETFTPAPVPPPSTFGPRNRKALLVGVNYLDSPDNKLNGCIPDVRRTAQRMHHDYQIKLLTDDQSDPYKRPTRQGIMNGIAWMLQGVQANDGVTLYFHFSGHGSQVEDLDGDEEDGLDETIVPCDFKSAGMITDDELQDDFLRKVPVGNRVLAIMDCCHSGTVLDLPYYAVPKKDMNDKCVDMVGDRHSRNNRVDCDAIMISGCEDAQCSMDVGAVGESFMALADKGAGGALTAAFLTIVQREPNVTLEGILLGIRKELMVRNFDQVPQISASKPYDMKTTYFDLFPEQLGNFSGQPNGPSKPSVTLTAAGNEAMSSSPLGSPQNGSPYPPMMGMGAPPMASPIANPMSPQGVSNPLGAGGAAGRGGADWFGPSAGAAQANPYAAPASPQGSGYVPPPMPPAAGDGNVGAAPANPYATAAADNSNVASPTAGAAPANPYASPTTNASSLLMDGSPKQYTGNTSPSFGTQQPVDMTEFSEGCI